MAIVAKAMPSTQSLPSILHGQPLAAIYARVSTTDQADKGYSIPSQIEACQELAQQHGYSVPESHIFQDDYTGTSLNRPQLARLRDLGQQRLLHAVIVYDLDRLSRKLAHQLLLTEEFEQAAVVLHIVSMPHGAKTPETQLFDHMRGVFAEYERAKILERTARGRRARSMEGYVPCGGATFGYIYVKHAAKGEHYDHIHNQCSACGQKGDKGACYAVHPEQASLVQRIFRMYVESGKSLQAIAAMLTEEGICTPKNQKHTVPAKVWRLSTVAVSGDLKLY